MKVIKYLISLYVFILKGLKMSVWIIFNNSNECQCLVNDFLYNFPYMQGWHILKFISYIIDMIPFLCILFILSLLIYPNLRCQTCETILLNLDLST